MLWRNQRITSDKQIQCKTEFNFTICGSLQGATATLNGKQLYH